ncbi:MAG TPA: hypothetical protein VKC60_05410 [Opitutaceae bacterium]|nr:hypothetical protein [Opitutaceae bacterium]
MDTIHAPVSLPDFILPKDYAWQTGLIAAIEQYLYESNRPMRYNPPRFIGYYFLHGQPIALCRNIRAALPPEGVVLLLAQQVHDATKGLFSLTGEPREEGADPLYLLVHDNWDGSCSLWPFAAGRRFVTALRPVIKASSSADF